MDTLTGKISRKTLPTDDSIFSSKPVDLIENTRLNDMYCLTGNTDKSFTMVASLRFIVGLADSQGFATCGGMQVTTCMTITTILGGLRWIP